MRVNPTNRPTWDEVVTDGERFVETVILAVCAIAIAVALLAANWHVPDERAHRICSDNVWRDGHRVHECWTPTPQEDDGHTD